MPNAFQPCAAISKVLPPFDIIFLDPPFHQDLIETVSKQLEENHYLAEGAYIYIEAESTLDPFPIPSHWEVLRSKMAGQVGYHLIKVGLSDEQN